MCTSKMYFHFEFIIGKGLEPWYTDMIKNVHHKHSFSKHILVITVYETKVIHWNGQPDVLFRQYIQIGLQIATPTDI